MTSPASCVCEPQRIVGGCAICNGASVVSNARLEELIEFHRKLRCLYAEQHEIHSACIADDVVMSLEQLRQLRALALTQRLGPMEG